MKVKRREVDISPKQAERIIGIDNVAALGEHGEQGFIIAIKKEVEIVTPVLRECCIINRKAMIAVRKMLIDTAMCKVYDLQVMLNKQNIVCNPQGQAYTFETLARVIGFDGVTDKYNRLMSLLVKNGIIAYREQQSKIRVQRIIVYNPYICTRSYEIDKDALSMFEQYKFDA